MSFAEAYLEKVSLDPGIELVPASPNLAFIVTIPASNEPDLLQTLNCLAGCTPPSGDIEIIIVLNSGESATSAIVSQNLVSSREITGFAKIYSKPEFRVLHTNIEGIRKKDTGAGYARKIAMDHAISRFSKIQTPKGIIISLDADTLCEKNYFTSIENHFNSFPDSRACSIYFEHPLEGDDFPESVFRGITEYELHMRYYLEGLRYAGHPHAYHTVGSAFCIRAETYVSQGGMNRRSAGEDFYFLQKIIPLGNFTELNNTRVIPSPRPSERVAFGTGPIVTKFLSGSIEYLESYNPGVFSDLREFFQCIPSLYGINKRQIQILFRSLPESIQVNLGNEFFERIEETSSNAAGRDSFTKRFFRWFNMFRTLKYINFAHQEYYSRLSVEEAVRKFLNGNGIKVENNTETVNGPKDLLLLLRKMQRRIPA